MEVRLLGAVELRAYGRPVPSGGPRQRSVLAALAVDVGGAVPAETVIDRVWGTDPPARARHTLHVYVARLRKLLAPEHDGGAGGRGAARQPLVRRGSGYALDLPPDRVDVCRFRDLVASGNRVADTARRAAALQRALASWGGTPLAGLPGEWAAGIRQVWADQHLEAVLSWAEAELAAGDPRAVVAALRPLAAENPFAEGIAAVLIRALSAAGRRAEALTSYDALRRRLRDELGCEPGAQVQQVWQAVLRGTHDPVGEAVPTSPRDVPGIPVTRVRPAQLPADVPALAGRREELARLDAVLRDGPGTRPGGAAAGALYALTGGAGVGKTALAVHWAHRSRERFPDGQLYVNLRGFDPSRQVTTPGDALRGFLEALGVSPHRVPAGLDAQTGLYRSLLSGRRMVVVLDNARDADHVRPLLPGAGDVATLVTSRDQLTGLVAVEGARPVRLDVLDLPAALDLLRHRLGAGCVEAEPAAAAQLVTRCARLPLALGIVAARAEQTAFPLARLAEELGDRTSRLDALDTGDGATALRDVFSWSYATLSVPAARLFRLVGVHPGPDVSSGAAVSLAAVGVRDARRALAELVRANLLAEHRPGRFVAHDLLRDYATELCRTQDGRHAVRQATERLLDHYVHTGFVADRLVQPFRDPIPHPLQPPAAGVAPERLDDPARGMAWLDDEAAVLRAVLREAAGVGFDVRAWQLAWVLDTMVSRRGTLDAQEELSRTALRAALRWGDPQAEAYARRRVARTCVQQGRLDEAFDHLIAALDVLEAVADRAGQGHLHLQLAGLHERAGRRERALDHVRTAVTLYRGDGAIGEARALNTLSWQHYLLDDDEQALAWSERALAVLARIGDRWSEASTWDSMGMIRHRLGRYADAADAYLSALKIFRDLGDRKNEAATLRRLADSYAASGASDAARECRRRATQIYLALGYPDDRAGAQPQPS